jgi:hypothetical protein
MTAHGYRSSLMSAVDMSGNGLTESRWGQSRRAVATEIVIRRGPFAIQHIERIAAISSPWLRSYFGHSSG